MDFGEDLAADFGEDLAAEIVRELCLVIAELGGDMVVVALAGSFRDTLSDEEILLNLKDWNENFNEVRT